MKKNTIEYRKRSSLESAWVATLMIVLHLCTIPAHSEVPPLIQYQGRVVVDGMAHAGTGLFKFALVVPKTSGFDQAASPWNSDVVWQTGTNAAVANATWQPDSSIELNGMQAGHFSVALGGAGQPPLGQGVFLSGRDVRGEVYLRAWFSPDNVSYEELLPATRLGTVPYAFVAGQAETVRDEAITTDKLAPGAITAAKLAAGAAVANIGPGGISASQLGADVVTALGATIQQNSLVAMTALEAIAVGDAVAVSKDASNSVRLIKASAALGSRSAFFGFAKTAAAIGQPVTVQQFGPMNGFTGLLGGSSYYLATTDGAIAATLPAGNLLQIYVGYSLSTDTLFIDPFGVTKRWSAANYWGDGSDGSLFTAGNVNLDSTLDGDVVVKQYTQLTIGSGHAMTVDERCRGLVIYVDGNCTINGTLSMTARGAHQDPAQPDSIAATGIRLARRKTGANETLAASDVGGAGAGGVGAVWRTVEAKQPGIETNGRIYVISRSGGTGAAPNTGIEGPGAGGSILASGTGGGGSGGVSRPAAQPGQGGGGGIATCYSGGSGGGGYWGPGGGVGSDGAANGGPGGDGGDSGAGGAGNPGKRNAQNGTGGLLILLVRGELSISGTIEANGMAGGGDHAGGGGGSGGGRIIVLHAGTRNQTGQVRAAGGAGGTAVTSAAGGAGGAGDVTIEQIDP